MSQNRAIVSRFCAGCKHASLGERFSLIHLEKGAIKAEAEASHHLIFFFLSGRCKATIYGYPEVEVQANEMLFSAQGFSYALEALEPVLLLVHSYDVPEMVCNIGHAHDLPHFISKIEYSVQALEIRPALLEFLNSLKNYIEDGVICHQLHQLKQRELSVIFLYYYSGEEQAQFFYYILQCLNSFKAKVFKHYLSAKSVEDLADKCGSSRSTFLREFKKQFRTNPHEWMEVQSARFVRNKILETNLPLKHIVDEFGFSSISHLTSYCRRHFGMTANELRKKVENQKFNAV